MRVINADELLEWLKKATRLYKVLDDGGIAVGVVYRIADHIDRMSEAGAVPVVRCGDCYRHEDEKPGMVWCPYVVGSWVPNDWYCADGKRKD